jgi:aryl-alcohol dehydrogenase-like predicted oxidoreductase
MKKRILGKNGPELTEIGFGAWAIGGPWQWGWGNVDDDESVKAIHAALDGGINWIDTAAVYGFGHSEKVVAQAVKGIRKEVFIATKCGMINAGGGNAGFDLSASSVRNELENSLRNLQTDYVDLYQIHWPNPAEQIEEAWGELSKIKKEGKARFIGVSNFNVDQLKRCMAIDQIQSLQPPYSMVKKGVQEEILPFCLENEIGVVAYSPMGGGMLTGKFDKSKIAQDDWRQNNPMFDEQFLSKGLSLVEKLRPLAEKYGKTVGHIAVAWVLSNKAVTSAIVGARTKAQTEQNILGAEVNLSNDELNLINDYLSELGL